MSLNDMDMAKLSELEQEEIKNNPTLRMALALERIATAIEKLVPAPAYPCEVVVLKKYTEEPH